MKFNTFMYVVYVFCVFFVVQANAELSGNISLEYNHFFHGPVDPRQHHDSASFSFQPEYYYEREDSNQKFKFSPFFQYDAKDKSKTHMDIRELNAFWSGDNWELRTGISKVFWGVTESIHLVDVINQMDLLENIQGKEKLGQPMINLSLIRNWGTFNIFVLPYFRERVFPGQKGRLRSIPRVYSKDTVFEAKNKQYHTDWALRWSHTFDSIDIGIAHFSGTSRDPQFSLSQNGNENVLIPIYNLIDQTSIDFQLTNNDILWKLETIYRTGQENSFFAAVGGFEYTFSSIFETDTDIGVILEYLFNDRNNVTLNPFQNDIFLGGRILLNDTQETEILGGVFIDLDTNEQLYKFETNWRLHDNWKIAVESIINNHSQQKGSFYNQRQDDYIQMKLIWYF